MQSNSPDSYYQTNGSGSMEEVRGKRKRSQSQFSQQEDFNDSQNPYQQNGFYSEIQDQDDYDEEEDEQESFQDQESFQQPPQFTNNKPAKRSRPPAIFGGSKRKKSKGKAKANAAAAAASNLNQQQFNTGQEAQAEAAKKKPDLATLQRPLLALDVPNLSSLDDTLGNEEAQELKLWLKEDDKRKLQVVISSIDPSLLSEPLPSLNPSDEDESVDQTESLTLDKALQTGVGEKGIELKELVLRLHALRQPLLTSSSLADADDHEEEDQSFESGDQQEVKNKNGTSKVIKDSKVLEQEKIRLSNLTLVSSLLVELATQHRDEDLKLKGDLLSGLPSSANGINPDGSVDEDHELAVLLGLEEPKKEKSLQAIRKKDERLRKFALHMRLPDGDYFTNAVEMTDEMVEELDTGHADLIEVLPDSQTNSLQAVPSLGSRLPLHSSLLPPRLTSAQIKERKHNVLVPTKSTSFGEFSSFLPGYDSKNSSMSFGASEAVWRYKTDERRLRTLEIWTDPEGSKAYDWKNRNNIEELIEEPPAAPVASTSSSKSDSTPSLEELLSKPVPRGIDADLLRSSAVQLEMEEQIRGELIKNSELVRKLQSYQWDRLRREFSRRRNQDLEIKDRLKALPQNKNGTVSEKDALEVVKRIRKESDQIGIHPGEEEQRTAKELFDSLSKLIGSHDISYGERLIPNISYLRSLAASSATSNISGSNVPKGFWGTLPIVSSEDSEVPSSIVDNKTFRLTTQSEEIANADAGRNDEVIGTTRDMNAGLLDRIADSREYDEKDDPHDLEPPQPQQQQQQVRPPVPSRQQRPMMINNNRNTSPNKSSPGINFQGQGQGQRFPPTPTNPAYRIQNQGFRPPFQQNGVQQGVGTMSTPNTPNQQLIPQPNGNVRPSNPLAVNNQMKFQNPNGMNVRPLPNQMTPQQQQLYQQQQMNSNPNQVRTPQQNGYQQMSPPAQQR